MVWVEVVGFKQVSQGKLGEGLAFFLDGVWGIGLQAYRKAHSVVGSMFKMRLPASVELLPCRIAAPPQTDSSQGASGYSSGCRLRMRGMVTGDDSMFIIVLGKRGSSHCRKK